MSHQNPVARHGRRDLLRAGATLSAAALIAGAGSARAQAAAPVVATTAGRLRGVASGEAFAFRGIPYGAATGGARRFAPPEPPAPWRGIRDATTHGASAPQLAGAAPPAEFAWYWSSAPQSEDALTLAVYTPDASTARKRPVLLWLHGGAFSSGAGTSAGFDGSWLARRQDVVVVSINHRLNLFGSFFTGEAQDGLPEGSGNLAVLDQIAALRWVRDNILSFGGDPGNVTIFGQSGGAAKVATLLAAPAARGLFHRAAIQSASGAWRLATPENAARSAHALLQEFGWSARDAARLREVPVDKLLAAYGKVLAANGGIAEIRPTLDGVVFPQHPFDPAASDFSRDIPLLIGTTTHEATFFLASDPRNFALTEAQLAARLQRFLRIDAARTQAVIAAYRRVTPAATPSQLLIAIAGDYNYRLPTALLADRQALQASAPVHAYSFNWTAPARGGVLGAPHTGEVPFIFGTLEAARALVGEDRGLETLRDKISGIWAGFARDGHPRGAATPDWQAYTPTQRWVQGIGQDWRPQGDLLATARTALGDLPSYEYSVPVTFTRD
ncbi:carboxylesterase/lipase family protein [Roseomonas sp. 18066]|uniref:carboxylesterase/lipase family protein n=1 Tax=Roseomonas sp. 18066 TaxID=2681412 RepID=UPI00135A4412|nr:carboxylesterase family protein [Roseomonas sp. 18066]